MGWKLRQIPSGKSAVPTDTSLSSRESAKPGQLRRQARLIKPNISIITLVALEHYSAFRTLDSVANEKAELVRALSEQGLAILNFDNSLVRAMSEDMKARVVGFGIESGDL